MKAETARLFFALNPDPDLRAQLVELQLKAGLGARPVRAANLHMTLAFLGNLPVDRIPELCDIASQLNFPRFTIQLDRTGVFPRAAVGWLGSSTPPVELIGLQSGLVRDLKMAGFRPDDRKWIPHVTLYRDLRKPFGRIHFEALRWMPESFCLLQSKQGKFGHEYLSRGRWPE